MWAGRRLTSSLLTAVPSDARPLFRPLDSMGRSQADLRPLCAATKPHNASAVDAAAFVKAVANAQAEASCDALLDQIHDVFLGRILRVRAEEERTRK